MRHPRVTTLRLAMSITIGAGLIIPAISQADNAIVEFSSAESGQCLQPSSDSLGATIVQESCNGSLA